MNDKEVWCQVKSSTNKRENFRECHKCCIFCGDIKTCEVNTCEKKDEDELCCWQASPSEWMMGRLDKRAEEFTWKRRQREHFMRNGHTPYDGSWEGERLAEWQRNYPEDYEEMFVEFHSYEESRK